ncbi:hypothetical protein HPC37_06545 [Pasteurellaceae bacterium 20609_3]|nr:hypothetical protein [Spirabiliibacterium mucosae]
MLKLGLSALQHSNWHANYYSFENDMWHELSVLQAAHAMEILIKARIAEEHPLLIFETLPKYSEHNDKLNFIQLLDKSRTIPYSELPDRLWITTGIKLSDRKLYDKFGKLRNSIQHFKEPLNKDFSEETLKYIYSIIDPFINQCWELYAINYNEDTEPYQYLLNGLIRRNIKFLVPENTLEYEIKTLDFSECSDNYRKEMIRRFINAGYTIEEI